VKEPHASKLLVRDRTCVDGLPENKMLPTPFLRCWRHKTIYVWFCTQWTKLWM